jgi:CO/xanthine dehydrogenase Mo-binding subunit
MAKIGESVKRVGIEDRVSGALRFAADLKFNNILHIRLVRLDVGRARINRIDTSKAVQLPGVRYVFTADDMPKPMPLYGPFFDDQPMIAAGETKFHGDPVAAVVAESEEIAERAAKLVEVDFDELDGVYSVEQALAADAPLVMDPFIRVQKELAHTNIFDEYIYGWGDPENAQADVTVEDEFTYPMTTHFAIEPHVFIAAPDQDGVLIRSTVQHPFLLQRVISNTLKIPVSKIRVIPTELGGAFGGKGYPKFEPLVAFIAMKLNQPVRLRFSLEETFLVGRRTSSSIRVTAGFMKDGRLSFMKVSADFLMGAFSNASPRVVAKAANAGCGIYNPPNAAIHARAILSHTIPGTAYRGFGAPQFMWALDSIMDMAAKELDIDRLEIRLKNMPNRGDVFLHGEKPCDGDWKDGLSKAAEAIGWGTPLPENRGRGLGIGVKTPAPATVSQSMVRMHHDGSLTVLVGTTEMGQGARTVMAQLASDAMDIPMDRISIINGDTGVVPFDSVTASSRSTVFMGNAVQRACYDLKKKLVDLTVNYFEVNPESIDFVGGQVVYDGGALEYEEVLTAHFGGFQGEVIGLGTYKEPLLKDHPLKGGVSFYEVIFAGVEVEVDKETGIVHMKKLVTVGDVGKAINPLAVETQDEGGAIMGLGHSLMEHLIMDERGRILNLGALDYRIPTTLDIPEFFQSKLIENMDGTGPSGAKGVGESGIIPIGSAVGLAVAEATGVFYHDLPLTPERVWQGLQERA